MPVTSSHLLITHLGYSAEPLLAAAGVVELGEAKPRGELATGAVLGGISHGRGQGGSAQQAHARHDGDTPGQIVGAMPGQKIPLQLPDAVLSLGGLLGQGSDHLGRQLWDLVGLARDDPSDERRGVGDALGGMSTPNSASRPRIMLTNWVRCLTSRSRVRCSYSAPAARPT